MIGLSAFRHDGLWSRRVPHLLPQHSQLLDMTVDQFGAEVQRDRKLSTHYLNHVTV